MAFKPQEQLSHIPIVAQQSAQMSTNFRTWSPSFWQRTTLCSDWKAADIVAHLATGADFYTAVLTAARQGEPARPWGATTVEEIGKRRTAAVQALLASGPNGLINGFEQAAARLQEVLAALSVDDLALPAWHPQGPIAVGRWVGMRLFELALHELDMHRPHEVNFPLSPLALPALLCSLPEIQMRFFDLRLCNGFDGTHVFQVGNTSWAFMIEGNNVTLEEGEPTIWTSWLQTDVEHGILLTFGRAEFAELLQNDALTLTGDTEMAENLFALLFQPYVSSSAR